MTTPTTDEYTNPQFAVVFYRAMADWHEAGADKKTDPRMSIEQRPNSGWQWLQCDADSVMRGVGGFFRWKPTPKRMVKIGYLDSNGDWQQKELVAPETVAPRRRTYYFHICDIEHGPWESFWEDTEIHQSRLLARSVFLTREDAQAMSDWQTLCRNGGAK